MVFDRNVTAPPTYTAEMVENYLRKTSTNYMINVKLEMYRAEHKGKNPARIFISDSLSMELYELSHFCQTTTKRKNKLFGIPFFVFPDDGGPRIYLSEEEER